MHEDEDPLPLSALQDFDEANYPHVALLCPLGTVHFITLTPKPETP
jgi:hypothetical protein